MSENIDENTVIKGGGNIYKDLGDKNPDEMLFKGLLVIAIENRINSKGMTMEKAAEMAGIQLPEMSRILKGRFRDIGFLKILGILVALGENIMLTDGPEPLVQFQSPPMQAKAVNG
jgi:predicted XRE-type DNA-binding protein